MQQPKIKYFISSEEVSKEDFQNKVGDYVTNVSDDNLKVFSVPFNSFFAENKDNNKLIKREINDFLKFTMLDKELDNIKGHSTRHKAHTYMNRLIEDELEKHQSEVKTFHENRDRLNQFFRQPTKKETIEVLKNIMKVDLPKKQDVLEMGQIFDKKTAYKETEGKLFYELDWGFITQMAERMSSNKKEGKYDLFNWTNPMTPKGIEDLKQATMRHLLEIMQGRYEDDGREFGHIEAVSDNMMMLNYQLKNK